MEFYEYACAVYSKYYHAKGLKKPFTLIYYAVRYWFNERERNERLLAVYARSNVCFTKVNSNRIIAKLMLLRIKFDFQSLFALVEQDWYRAFSELMLTKVKISKQIELPRASFELFSEKNKKMFLVPLQNRSVGVHLFSAVKRVGLVRMLNSVSILMKI